MKPFAGGVPVFRPGKGDLAMIATCIAAFIITFGVLWTGRKSEAPSPPVNEIRKVAAQPDAVERPRDSVRPRQSNLPQPDRVRPIQQAAAIPVSTAPSTANPSSGELPVEVSFRRGRGTDSYLEGSIFNRSSEDLQVEVDFYKPATKRTSNIELTVPANHASAFGRDDGMEIEGGDQVTVKSPSYTEKHVEVR